MRVETFDRFTNEALSYILILMKEDAFLNDIYKRRDEQNSLSEIMFSSLHTIDVRFYRVLYNCVATNRKCYTRGDPEIRGKVLLNRIAFIDCNENSQT